jgi:hypothetical protein
MQPGGQPTDHSLALAAIAKYVPPLSAIYTSSGEFFRRRENQAVTSLFTITCSHLARRHWLLNCFSFLDLDPLSRSLP